jgi:hypothetical protein
MEQMIWQKCYLDYPCPVTSTNITEILLKVSVVKDHGLSSTVFCFILKFNMAAKTYAF